MAYSKKSVDSYYLNPNHCLQCKKVIEVVSNRVGEARIKKFCNRSCSASYNNSKFPKRKSIQEIVKERISICESCESEIVLKRKNRSSYYLRRFCDKCLYEIRVQNGKKMVSATIKNPVDRNVATKGDIKKRFDGDTLRVKIYITTDASRFYWKYGLKQCALCEYSKHINVCHIKSVSSFPDNATLSDINSKSNLISLCPNHHWEFDHDALSDEMKLKIQGIAQ